MMASVRPTAAGARVLAARKPLALPIEDERSFRGIAACRLERAPTTRLRSGGSCPALAFSAITHLATRPIP